MAVVWVGPVRWLLRALLGLTPDIGAPGTRDDTDSLGHLVAGLYRDEIPRGTFRPMSRRQLLAALARHRGEVLRDTGAHTIFVRRCGEHRAPVPRHGTITAGVVSSIGRQMACPDEGGLQ